MSGNMPQWDVPESYGNIKSWSFFRWRWEFFRRRDDLQECFIAHSNWENATGLVSSKDAQKGMPGHYVKVGHPDVQKFGYLFLPDPSVSNHPESLLEVLPDEAPTTDCDLHGTGNSAYDDLISMNIELPNEFIEQIEFLKDCEITSMRPKRTHVGFDLSKPIIPQIRMAEFYLRNLQKEKLGRIVQAKRRHPKKWFGYLRTIDARADGTTWAQIAGIHSATAQTEQTSRDIWEQAVELCFNF